MRGQSVHLAFPETLGLQRTDGAGAFGPGCQLSCGRHDHNQRFNSLGFFLHYGFNNCSLFHLSLRRIDICVCEFVIKY